MANKEEVQEWIKECIEEACQPGGSIHAINNNNKDNNKEKRKDGIAGVLCSKSDRMQPAKFESEVKSGIQYKHWNEEMKSYLKIVDPHVMCLIQIAEKNPETKTGRHSVEEYITVQSNIADKDKFFLKFLKDSDANQVNMLNTIIETKDEEFHTMLMLSLGGEAKEMVRNAAPSGIEAWRSLNYRWNRKTQFGATQIAEMIAKITPAKSPDEIYTKLNQLERLHLELQRNLGEDIINGQPVKVVYGEAFKKSDLLRVVNEEFNSQLKREGQELEKMTYQSMVDKVQAYVRLNSKNKNNDIGALNMHIENDKVEDEKKEDVNEEAEEEWPRDENWIGFMGYKGPDKGKGKGYGFGYGGKGGKGDGKGFGGKGFGGKGDGKGFGYGFQGTCHSCGKYGHRAAECRSKGAFPKGGGKGGYEGGGKSGFGKGKSGTMNMFDNQDDLFASRPQATGGGAGYGKYDYPQIMNMAYGHQICHLEERSAEKQDEKNECKLCDWIEIAIKKSDEKMKNKNVMINFKNKNMFEDLINEDEELFNKEANKETNEKNIFKDKFKEFPLIKDNPIKRRVEKLPGKGTKVAKTQHEGGQRKKQHTQGTSKEDSEKVTAIKGKRCPAMQDLVDDDDGDYDWKKYKRTLVNLSEQVNLFEHKNDNEEKSENSINTVEEGWEFLAILIDSGSTETVAPPDTLKGYDLVSTDWSEAGKGYSAANGTDIPNLGEKIVRGQASNGMWCTMRFQICSVTKPLGSVSRICQAGSRVVFGPPEEGSYIEHVVTGKRTMLRQSKGLYYLDVWIAPATTFRRQGSCS
jgi:hypothetical protein